MFGVIVGQTVNEKIFSAFSRGIKYIAAKYNNNNREQVQKLFEKEYKLTMREIAPNINNGNRYYVMTFNSEQDYFYFLLKWT